MKILKLSTITLSGLLVLSLGGCDTEKMEPDKEAKDDLGGSLADEDAPAVVIAGPGDAARELAAQEDNFCAFAVGECLSATKTCKGNDGEGCEQAFAECRDEHVAQHCELAEKLVAGVNATLSCWKKFGDCSERNGGTQPDCLAKLQACMAEEMGCDGQGCGDKISWPSDEDANWPVSKLHTMEEVKTASRARPGYYRDRYGRLWYRDRRGRWYRVGGGGGWPKGGGGGWPGGGGGGG